MPKERVHWSVALRAAEGLSSTGDMVLAPAIAMHRRYLLLGAVAPDTLYYYNGAKPAVARAAADRAHGAANENTFAFAADFVRLFAGLRSHDRRETGTLSEEAGAAYAFLAGVLCHIATDATCHPFVYYLCGSGVDDSTATFRHWVLETALDLHLVPAQSLPNQGRYARLLSGPTDLIERFLAIYYFGDPERESEVIASAVDAHARRQALFYSRSAAFAISVAGVFSHSTGRYRGLSYAANSRRNLAGLDRRIAYRHPVTGEEFEETPADLVERATERSLDLLVRAAACLAAPDPGSCFGDWTGPSLETGLEPSRNAAMKYHDTALFDEVFARR